MLCFCCEPLSYTAEMCVKAGCISRAWLLCSQTTVQGNRLAAMREECTAALRTVRMPTTRSEEYRFTDISPILQTVPRVRAALCNGSANCTLLLRLSTGGLRWLLKQRGITRGILVLGPKGLDRPFLCTGAGALVLPLHPLSGIKLGCCSRLHIPCKLQAGCSRSSRAGCKARVRCQVAEGAPADVEAEAGRHPLEGACARVVVVDGAVHPGLSDMGGLPEGAYVGPLAGAPAELVADHLARRKAAWSIACAWHCLEGPVRMAALTSWIWPGDSRWCMRRAGRRASAAVHLRC